MSVPVRPNGLKLSGAGLKPRNSWSAERLWRADLADAITDAGQDPARWQDVVAAFAARWPGIKAAFQALDLHAPQNSGVYQSGLNPEFVKSYILYYAHLNVQPWRETIVRAPMMKVQISANVVPLEMIRNTEFYNDWVRPQKDVEQTIGLKLAHDTGKLINFSFNYGTRQAEYINRVLPPLMQKLAPALRSAVALNQALRSKRALSAALDVVLDTLDSPAFVLDAKGRMRHANGPALAAAEAGRLIRIGPAAVSFRCRKAQARLSEALAALSVPGAVPCGDAPIASPDGPVAALASFHAVKSGAIGQAALGWLTQPENWLLVIVREFGFVSVTVSPHGLRQAFGLTQAEARLAAGLAGGAALDDVADTLGITKETARSHLKAIFAKTETHRQPELVALLARLARRP